MAEIKLVTRFDEPINGTADMFWELAQIHDDERSGCHIKHARLPERSSIRREVEVPIESLYSRTAIHIGTAYITTAYLPNDETLVRVLATDDEWPIVEPLWLAIKADLQKYELLAAQENESEEEQQGETFPAPGAKKSIATGMRLETGKRILQLLINRKKWLKYRSPRDFTVGCETTGIEPETVTRHYPQLQVNWHNKDYQGDDVVNDILRQHPHLKDWFKKTQ